MNAGMAGITVQQRQFVKILMEVSAVVVCLDTRAMEHRALVSNSQYITQFVAKYYVFPDIDECEGERDDCDVNADCYNTNGGYNCTCQEGFTGTGRICSGTLPNHKPYLQNMA